MGLGGRPVNLVRKQERGEYGAFDEVELVFAQVEHVGTGYVRGHQVRRELYSGELTPQNLCKRADKKGLGNAGHAFNQGMLPGEDGYERFLDNIVLADDYFADLVSRPGQGFFESVEVWVHDSIPFSEDLAYPSICAHGITFLRGGRILASGHLPYFAHLILHKTRAGFVH